MCKFNKSRTNANDSIYLNSFSAIARAQFEYEIPIAISLSLKWNKVGRTNMVKSGGHGIFVTEVKKE